MGKKALFWPRSFSRDRHPARRPLSSSRHGMRRPSSTSRWRAGRRRPRLIGSSPTRGQRMLDSGSRTMRGLRRGRRVETESGARRRVEPAAAARASRRIRTRLTISSARLTSPARDHQPSGFGRLCRTGIERDPGLRVSTRRRTAGGDKASGRIWLVRRGAGLRRRSSSGGAFRVMLVGEQFDAVVGAPNGPTDRGETRTSGSRILGFQRGAPVRTGRAAPPMARPPSRCKLEVDQISDC